MLGYPVKQEKRFWPRTQRTNDEGIGFSHAMTGHHFHLFPDGGSIEVKSERPDDNASKEAIRRHLKKVAGMFAQGDFSLPAGSIGQRAVCDP